MKRITVISGTRAEFGLLRPLIQKIIESKKLQLQLVITAMHLSPEFGNTVEEIESLGFKIDRKIECLLSSDTSSGISKSIGLAIIGFADAFSDLKSDMVVVLGDRTELLAGVTAAMIANIPVAHISGGDTTEGAYDEAIRHAITKMSYLHFPSTETYRRRIIQLGENPSRIYNVGALGLDSIKNLNLLDRKEFEQSINFSLGIKNILVTFHPVTLENRTAEGQFQNILDVLTTLEDTHIIFTHANSDKNGRVINKMIEDFTKNREDQVVSFKSLGQLRYLSALQHVDLVLGNSSSGIVEVPFFNIPTINIGDRQKGRISAESVLHTETDKKALIRALNKAYDTNFRQKINTQKQIYGDGNAAAKIVDVIEKISIKSLKKKFFDINFNL